MMELDKNTVNRRSLWVLFFFVPEEWKLIKDHKWKEKHNNEMVASYPAPNTPAPPWTYFSSLCLSITERVWEKGRINTKVGR